MSLPHHLLPVCFYLTFLMLFLLPGTRVNGSTAGLGSASASNTNLQAAAAATGTKGSSVKRFQEDEVLVEQLTRNIQFFGADAQQQIADAFVVVVGLGVSVTEAVLH